MRERDVHVRFTSKQFEFIKKSQGELGATNAEVVKNMCLFWLQENNLLSKVLAKKWGVGNGNRKK